MEITSTLDWTKQLSLHVILLWQMDANGIDGPCMDDLPATP